MRYPAAYARARDAWSLVVAQAVQEAHWRPPPAARYRVAVVVYGGGKRDLDRICTAALDALQAGGAVRDDCLVDALAAVRHRSARGAGTATVVSVAPLSTHPASRRATDRRGAPTSGTVGTQRSSKGHDDDR